MKICITIRHPARVHLFKHVIESLEADGHDINVVTIESEIVVDLLDAYGIDHVPLLKPSKSLFDLVVNQTAFEIRLMKFSLDFRPDLFVDGIASTHVSTLLGVKSIKFADTEHAGFTKKLSVPFVTKIFTPDCYRGDLGPKQNRYPGYHELAYLHPNRFEPDPSVLDEAGLSTDDRFVILRTVDWQALHDIGDSGFDDIVDVVTQLEATGAEVLITAEGDLPDSVSHCQLDIEPHRIHDLMAYADLFVGESATMASESAVLGTPAVFISSSRRGYTDELEEEYGLVFNFSGSDRQVNGVNQAISILDEYNKDIWEYRRQQVLADKIDVTEFMIEQIKNATRGNNQ